MIAMIFALALGAANPCGQFFAGGVAPVVETAQQVCETGYAVGYREDWGATSLVAEALTPDSVAAGKAEKRNGAFHECDLPDGTKSVPPSVYARSGYDLGHQVPAGDRGPDKPETFCTLNMSPQTAVENREMIAGIEESLRKLASTGETLFVVTGPIIPPMPAKLGGVVDIPSGTYKAVYEPGHGAEAWTCSDVAQSTCAQTPIQALDVAIGFDAFPGIPDDELTPIELPQPTKGSN